MNADKIQHVEILLERKLEPEEKEQLRRIGSVLGLHSDIPQKLSVAGT